jgi:hypothetical protein
MTGVVPVKREEVSVVSRPFKRNFLLFSLNRHHVLIHSAILKFEFFAARSPVVKGSYIFEELVVDFCKLESKVHACCNHDVLALIVIRIAV